MIAPVMMIDDHELSLALGLNRRKLHLKGSGSCKLNQTKGSQKTTSLTPDFFAPAFSADSNSANFESSPNRS